MRVCVLHPPLAVGPHKHLRHAVAEAIELPPQLLEVTAEIDDLVGEQQQPAQADAASGRSD